MSEDTLNTREEVWASVCLGDIVSTRVEVWVSVYTWRIQWVPGRKFGLLSIPGRYNQYNSGSLGVYTRGYVVSTREEVWASIYSWMIQWVQERKFGRVSLPGWYSQYKRKFGQLSIPGWYSQYNSGSLGECPYLDDIVSTREEVWASVYVWMI